LGQPAAAPRLTGSAQRFTESVGASLTVTAQYPAGRDGGTRNGICVQPNGGRDGLKTEKLERNREPGSREGNPLMLERDEMIEILEDIARNSRSAVARIQAIKVLRTLEDERPEQSAFDELYEVDARRRSGPPARDGQPWR
jgi:hypothetical protein